MAIAKQAVIKASIKLFSQGDLLKPPVREGENSNTFKIFIENTGH
jgi:hypothetical protein